MRRAFATLTFIAALVAAFLMGSDPRARRRHFLRYALAFSLALVLLSVLILPTTSSADTCTARLDCQINEARIAVGLPPLAASLPLALAAQQHATEIAARGVLLHEINGRNQQDRAYAQGHTDWLVSEVLVMTTGTVADAIQALMASPPHRAILLSGSYSVMGLGRVERDGAVYWSVSLGRAP